MSFMRLPDGSALLLLNADGSPLNIPWPQREGDEPVNTVAPTLTGTANVGSTLTITAGTWTDADTVARDLMSGSGVLVADVGSSYVVQASDDMDTLYVRETGTSSWGSVVVVSASLTITYAAPAASGTISAQSWTQGTGTKTIDLTSYFTGSNLTYSLVSGPANVELLSSIVSVSTNEVLAASPVVVRATNSGGSADQEFTVTVTADTAPSDPLAAIPLEDIELRFLESEDNPGSYTWVFIFASVPATATRLWWRGTPHVVGQGPGSGYHPLVLRSDAGTGDIPANAYEARAVTSATDMTPTEKDWLWVNTFGQIGEELTHHIMWSDDAGLAIDDVPTSLSDPSDALVQVVQLYVPPVTPTSTLKRLPAALQQEWGVPGYVPADTMQQWQAVHWCMGSPDHIYGVQDAGGLWYSEAAGASWLLPARTGIGSYQCNGVAVDPVDPLRVLVNVSGGNYPVNVPGRGLYASLDGAATFEPRIVAGGGNSSRGTHSAMAWDPDSVGVSRAERWLAIADGPNGPTSVPIMCSTNGWESWTQRGTWNKTTYGSSRFAVGDPAVAGRFYIACEQGLVRIANAFTGTMSFTNLSGSNGLPAGGINGRPYISADGQTIIVGCSSGIYRTTNGGTSWSKRGTETGFARVEVNPYNPDHMVLIYAEGSSQQLPKYSTDGVAFTSTLAANVERRGNLSYTPQTQYNFAHVAFHSTAGKFFMAGRQTVLPQAANHYRSVDYGQHLLLANEGFNGFNHAIRQQAPSLWGGDKYTFALSAQDLGCIYTKNGGKWFLDRTLKQSVVGEHPSCYGIAVHPDPTETTILAAVGNGNVTLWGSHDDTVTWASKQALGGKFYSVFFGNDPSYAFAGRYRSTNDGSTWAAMTGLPAGGAVFDRGPSGTIWAIDSSGKRDVWRSTNNGGAWTKVHTLSRSCTVTGSPWGPFAAHPTDGDVFFSMGANDQGIARYDVGAGTVTQLPLFSGTPPSYVTPVCVQQIAVDPRFPDVMHISTLYAGSPRVYTTTDAGETWTANADFPQQCNHNAITVSPYTGEVLTGGSNGMYLAPPPYAQSGLIMDELPYGAYIA